MVQHSQVRIGTQVIALAFAVCSGCQGPTTSGYEQYYELTANLVDAEVTESVRHPNTAPGNRASAPEQPSASTSRQFLFLPSGSAVEFPVLAAEKTLLRAESLALRGSDTRLQITLETDEGGVQDVVTISEPRREVEVQLPAQIAGPLLLKLAALGSMSEGNEGVLLQAPALWRPESRKTADPVTRRNESRPNIVFYLIDTLRRDHLGCYGYPKPTSPNIDAFSKTSTLFLDAVAQSSWTKASMASIFTGMWPPAHGATQWQRPLADDRQVLGEMLKAVGYRTAGIVANVHLVEKFGFAQGFDDYIEALAQQKNGSLRPFSSSEINDAAVDWLEAHGSEGPFFLYLHTFDPHDPYEPPIEFGKRFRPRRPSSGERGQYPVQVKSSFGIGRFFIKVTGPSPQNPEQEWPLEAIPQLKALYDGEIAWNDDSFGKLVAYLKDRGLYEDSLIIVASDHGDEFHEHGSFRHGYNLHAETLNVPLIIKFPRQQVGRVVSETVQHTDLLPTILEYVGAEAPLGLDGRSLLGVVGGDGQSLNGRAILSFKNVFSPPHLSVIVDDWKLLLGQTQDGNTVWTRLYNRTKDPDETWDVAAENPIRTAVLEAVLRQRLALLDDSDEVTEVELDDELIKTMRALGYLN